MGLDSNARCASGADCIKHGVTGDERSGWWYHGGTESECANDLASPEKIVTPYHASSLSDGCTHKGDHTHVIRFVVTSDDPQKSKVEEQLIAGTLGLLRNGEKWIRVMDADILVIDSDFGAQPRAHLGTSEEPK